MAGIGSGISAQFRRAPGQDEETGEPASAHAPGSREEMGEAEHQQGVEAATPEEQANYEQFLRNAVELTHGPDGQPTEPVKAHLQGQFEPEVMQMFEGVNPPVNPQSPSDCLALTGLLVVMATDASAMEAGKDVGNAVLLHAGAEIIAIFAEDAQALGLFESDDKGIEVACVRAADIYQQIDGPRINKEALTGEFEQLVQADREGRIDEVLPGAKEAAGMADAQPQRQGAMA